MDFSGIREYLIEQEAKCINESGGRKKNEKGKII